MLNELIEALPEELRRKYERVVRRGPAAQERMKLTVALHLWRLGLRGIEFERYMQLRDGRLIYVDVYEAGRRLYVECETRLSRAKIKRRSLDIRQVDPEGRFILAVQDGMALKARRFQRLVHDVWVVSRDGRVADLRRWLTLRRRELLEVVDRHELRQLVEYYREIKDCFDSLKAGRNEECAWIAFQLKRAAKIIVGESGLEELAQFTLQHPLDRVLNEIKGEMERVKREIQQCIVELTNKMISPVTPYVLEFRGGKCQIYMDQDAEEWLGWNELPVT